MQQRHTSGHVIPRSIESRATSARGLMLLAFLMLLVGAPPATLVAQAHEHELRGRITDRQGNPIAGARLQLLAGSTAAFAVTGADGRFHLRAPAGQSARLRVDALGYEPLDLPATAFEGASVDLVLAAAPRLLPEVSVIGSVASDMTGVAGAAAIVGPEVLHDRAPLSVMDALRTLPGVATADEDPFGLNLNVGMRGLPPRRSSRTLLLEDGVPILLGPYGDPSMHYAPPREALERVEVVKGSGQIVNGPQTVGGIINFVTHGPPDEGTTGELVLGAGSLAHRNAQLRLGAARRGLGVSLDHARRGGDGVRLEQGHRYDNTILKGLIPLGDRQALLLKAAMWTEFSRISETGLTQEEFEADPYSLPFSAQGRFDVRRYLGQAVHDAALGRVRLRTNAFLTRTDRASWRQSGESEERLGEEDYLEDFNCSPGATSYEQCGNQGRPREYTVMGVEPRLTLPVGAAAVGAVELGVRAYREDVRRRQFTGNTPTSREADATLTRDNTIETLALAAFAQGRIPVGPLMVSPGVRVERVEQEIRNIFPGREARAEQSFTQMLPGVGATLAPSAAATLFAGVHRGFAPPRPADIYRPEPGQPLVVVDPETSWNWEAGVRLTPRAGLGIDATLFRMDFDNQIIEAPAQTGQRFVNGGHTTHMGLELGAELSLGTLCGLADDFTFVAAWTWLPVARFDEGDLRGDEVAGNRLPYAPRQLASASAVLSHRSGLSLGAALEHTGAQFADEANTVAPSDDGQTGLLPAYTVANAFATFTIPRTGVQLRGSVRNAFDRVYITQRNEGIYTGVRRMARGEVRWEF